MPVDTIIPFPQNRPAPAQGLSLGGVMSAVGQHAIDEREKRALEAQTQTPALTALASHIRKAWEVNKREKDPVEQRMLKSMRQRRGEYDPDILAKIRKFEGSEIYMLLSSAKARAISSWLRDSLMADGTEKPWTLDATPIPQLPPDMVEELFTRAQQAMQLMADQGLPIDMKEVIEEQREGILDELKEEAKERAAKMEDYMEDQLVEGGFMKALSDVVDDITTFPAFILKGPVIRRRLTAQWVKDGDNWSPKQAYALVPEWERVDPFYVYPSPGAENPNEGDLIEFHRLSRADLQAMKGTAGYSDDAIDGVLREHGMGGLRNWTAIDSQRAAAEGRVNALDNPTSQIDALQYWGSVMGQHLLDWGMTEQEIPDPLAEYEVEAWLVGRWVIKAVLNKDAHGKRPYYKDCWETLPGMFWGNSPMDQIRDVQSMCNHAARSLANNMNIASGPMVWYNIDRLLAGENVEQLYPWKPFQTTGDPAGPTTAPPIGFFQPNSNAGELMGVYEKFSREADDILGVPNYMNGGTPGGGVGRSASGFSMAMNNAGKVIQQVVGSIDINVFTPLLTKLYEHNMLYAPDASIKGDAKVQARGAKSLMAREAAQLRMIEFLRNTNNPADLAITGQEGRAEVLREVAKTLNMPTDRIVPERPNPALTAGAAGVQPPAGTENVLPGGQPVVNAFEPPSQ
jgi:hypothetical protein